MFLQETVKKSYLEVREWNWNEANLNVLPAMEPENKAI